MSLLSQAELGKLFHKRQNERDGELERETIRSWIIGFILCGCSTWPYSLYLSFIKKAYN